MWQLFTAHQGRPVQKWTHYFPVYDRYFARWRAMPVTIVEIGVAQGGSLQLWKKYFGPRATIVGLDIVPGYAFEESQIHVRIGDQSDVNFLQSVFNEFGPPDIVIDDGSHRMNDIWASFEFLYPVMSRDGIYVVEDLHTAYWDEFEGGLRREGTFIERAKDMVDQLNARYTRGGLARSRFSATTMSISFYDSMVVLEKGPVRYQEAMTMPPAPSSV